LTQSWKDRLSAISLIVRFAAQPQCKCPRPKMTRVRPTDNVLRSHGSSTTERDRDWERERNFKSRECRKRRPGGGAGHSLFRRYAPRSPSPTLTIHHRQTNPRNSNRLIPRSVLLDQLHDPRSYTRTQARVRTRTHRVDPTPKRSTSPRTGAFRNEARYPDSPSLSFQPLVTPG